MWHLPDVVDPGAPPSPPMHSTEIQRVLAGVKRGVQGSSHDLWQREQNQAAPQDPPKLRSWH